MTQPPSETEIELLTELLYCPDEIEHYVVEVDFTGDRPHTDVRVGTRGATHSVDLLTFLQALDGGPVLERYDRVDAAFNWSVTVAPRDR